MTYLRMQLKVCEGCGNLWLRAGKEVGVYCPRCVRRLADFPPPRHRRRRARHADNPPAAEPLATGGVR